MRLFESIRSLGLVRGIKAYLWVRSAKLAKDKETKSRRAYAIKRMKKDRNLMTVIKNT